MSAIIALEAREVFDSRGWPTVEAEIILESGARGRAIAPAGASTGAREAKELRDGTERLGGRGVRAALEALRGEVFQAISGLEAGDQRLIDRHLCEIDGTSDKSRLGGNALLAASLAAAQAAAAEHGAGLWRHLGGAAARTLPVPMMNLINGGAHAGNPLEVQEFMAVPAGFGSFREALEAGAEVYHALRARLAAAGQATAVGDEGGFAPALRETREALDALTGAIEQAGLSKSTYLALDCAANELLEESGGKSGGGKGSKSGKGGKDGKDGMSGGWRYRLDGAVHERGAYLERLAGLAAEYPIISLEDPLAEDDDEGWRLLTSELGGRVQLVGDDHLTTNAARIRAAAQDKRGNAVLIKPNQAGTLSETLDALAEARRSGFAAIVSHRSGESEDVSIADLSVAAETGQIKAGAPCRGERTAKYNRLLRIEEALGTGAFYPGRRAFRASFPHAADEA